MTTRRYVPVIGLVGGVGSGKSAVARSLAERRSVAIVEGDQAGHDVLVEPTVKERIRRRFGASVFDDQGEIDRRALGQEVFGSSEEKRQALGDLEAIVHPRIREALRRQIEAARASGEVEAVILDAAVMLEAGWDGLCDAVVFVKTSPEERLQRVARSRGWTKEELNNREASQWPLDRKESAADHVISNSNTLQESADRLENIMDNLCRQHR